MAAEEVARIRNIGIVGQGGVGKTFLADALIVNVTLAAMNLVQDPTNAPHNTEIGQLHRYTPYETRPRPARGPQPSAATIPPRRWAPTAAATSAAAERLRTV